MKTFISSMNTTNLQTSNHHLEDLF